MNQNYGTTSDYTKQQAYAREETLAAAAQFTQQTGVNTIGLGKARDNKSITELATDLARGSAIVRERLEGMLQTLDVGPSIGNKAAGETPQPPRSAADDMWAARDNLDAVYELLNRLSAKLF